jgi:hypothetical protein
MTPGDLRARNLQLRPRKKQTSGFNTGALRPPMDDMAHIDMERSMRIKDYANRN